MERDVTTDQDYKLLMLLNQAHNAIGRARENEVRQFGISRIQAAVLIIVKNLKSPVTPAEISRWLFREPNTVSGVLNRMEREGLVRKVKNLERKNQIRIEITEKGEEAYRRSREMKVIRKILACLPRRKRDSLRAYLRMLRNRALAELTVGRRVPFP